VEPRQIALGANVESLDGKHLGKVDQVIVRSESQVVGGFLLSHHVFGARKLIPNRLIASSDEHLTMLSVTSAEAERIPNYVEEQMIRAPEELTYGVGFGGLVDLTGTGEKWELRGNEGGQYPHTGTMPFFFEAPIGEVDVENVSNLPEDGLLLNKGTHVEGADGSKVGRIEEVLTDERGVISGVAVSSGWLFKHHLNIPIQDIASTTSKVVVLKISGDEAKTRTA
jgi:uncharacterized protein YrrD